MPRITFHTPLGAGLIRLLIPLCVTGLIRISSKEEIENFLPVLFRENKPDVDEVKFYNPKPGLFTMEVESELLEVEPSKLQFSNGESSKGRLARRKRSSQLHWFSARDVYPYKKGLQDTLTSAINMAIASVEQPVKKRLQDKMIPAINMAIASAEQPVKKRLQDKKIPAINMAIVSEANSASISSVEASLPTGITRPLLMKEKDIEYFRKLILKAVLKKKCNWLSPPPFLLYTQKQRSMPYLKLKPPPRFNLLHFLKDRTKLYPGVAFCPFQRSTNKAVVFKSTFV